MQATVSRAAAGAAAAGAAGARTATPTLTGAAEFSVLWFDLSTHWATFGALFKWCDTAQAALFPADSPSPALRDLRVCWERDAVMRTNSARLCLPHAAFHAWPRVRVKPILTSVGRTSWVCGFHVVEPTPEERLMAVVQTVMVATDPETHSRSVELPHRQALQDLLSAAEAAPSPARVWWQGGLDRPVFAAEEDAPPSSPPPFRYTTHARITDCDALGHVNNAVYPTLGEEARLFAAHRNGFGDQAGAAFAARPASTCSVNYVGQAHPFDAMDVSTWVSGAGEIRVDFKTPSTMSTSSARRGNSDGGGGELLAQVVLGGLRAAPGPTPAPTAPSSAASL